MLSGPNIAYEINAGKPSAAVVASKDDQLTVNIQSLMGSKLFRVYTSSDLMGVQLGGVIKNIIAIAGVMDGYGMGMNAKAMFVSRSKKSFQD